jgi:hypothetical protein
MGVLQGLVNNGNGYLYAAWKGEPDDDRIFYSRWDDNGKWMSALTIPGNTSAGPALGVFRGSVYAAWKGEWSDPRLFFSRYDGPNWEAQSQIPNAYSDTGPALCSMGGNLIAVWKNVFDQSLYFATFDGGTWTTPSKMGGVGSSVGPSLAAYDGKLYAVWKGEGSDQRLWFAIYDGTSWSGQTPGSDQTQIPNVGTSTGASLAVLGTNLYAVWKGEDSDESLWYATYDGAGWSGQTQIAGVGTSLGAALAEFNGTLYAMCKGPDSDVSLYNAEWNGSVWSGWANDVPGNTGPDTYTLLAAPAGGNINYLLADSKGAATGTTVPLRGTTVTIIVVDDIVPDNGENGVPENYAFQINCLGPSQTSESDAFIWQQYGFRIAFNQLFFWVNTFDQGYNQIINWDSRPPRMSDGVVSLQNNRLPKGWQLTTTLVADSNGTVTGFGFSVAQPDGTILNPPAKTLLSLNTTVVPSNLAPIINYQAILVGENGRATTNFLAGKGIFQCYADNYLSIAVSEDESGEESNVTYSSLPSSYPNGEFYQLFGIAPV